LTASTGNFVLNEQDTASSGTVPGYGKDCSILNFWYVTQQCMAPNCQAIWTRLQGGTGNELWIAVLHASRGLEANTVLMMDYNELSGNISGDG
jgi:hypothetical protein